MYTLSNINNTFKSYQNLIEFYLRNKNTNFSNIEIELKRWFSANMCASLGAILDLFQNNYNEITFKINSNDIERILMKNNFLAHFGYSKLEDNHHTTIKYLKMKPSDGKYFKSYIINDLLGRGELPKMSIAAKNKIAEAIYEIFVNAQIHSETENIYTCGQFFPNKDKIEFTIVDTGIGFRERFIKRFNRDISSSKAIYWATQDKNTTKTDISGGIGLALLKDFTKKNKGKIQIISDQGFYELSKKEETIKEFNGSFPGTIVNLQFRTDDKTTYYSKSEININDIF